jgi:hypothetical protein
MILIALNFSAKLSERFLKKNCGSVAIVAYAVVFIKQKSDIPGDMTFCGNIQLKLLLNMLQLCPYFATSLSKCYYLSQNRIDNLLSCEKFVHFWGKKRIANFNHFLKNPLCEVTRPNVHVTGKRFRSTNLERPEKSSGPTDRAETLYFVLNTLNL